MTADPREPARVSLLSAIEPARFLRHERCRDAANLVVRYLNPKPVAFAFTWTAVSRQLDTLLGLLPELGKDPYMQAHRGAATADRPSMKDLWSRIETARTAVMKAYGC